MNNFGVVEIANTRATAAPGWAYVPDIGPGASASSQSTNRKRAARNLPGLSLSDQSARQEAKIRKELEALDRDTSRDVTIPIPGGRAQTKSTPNVRKILQSQKTFGNHLDDFEAMLALAESNPNSAVPGTGNSASGRDTGVKNQGPVSGANRRGGQVGKKEAGIGRAGAKAGGRTGSGRGTPAPNATDTEAMEIDTEGQGTDQVLLTPFEVPASARHPEDTNPLLKSWIPQPPTDAEIRLLLAEGPLRWTEARGSRQGGEDGYPARRFCNVCGYWGRVKCVKCSERVCGLECLAAHQDECVRRYGI